MSAFAALDRRLLPWTKLYSASTYQQFCIRMLISVAYAPRFQGHRNPNLHNQQFQPQIYFILIFNTLILITINHGYRKKTNIFPLLKSLQTLSMLFFTVMLVEINNVKQQENKRCKYRVRTCYLLIQKLQFMSVISSRKSK